jgi:hypothetical protein
LPSETDFRNITRVDNKAKNNSRNNASGIKRSEQSKQDGQAASARIAKKKLSPTGIEAKVVALSVWNTASEVVHQHPSGGVI